MSSASVGSTSAQQLEVAVADVADDWGGQTLASDVGLGGCDAVGQRGDRDTYVGGESRAARYERAGGVVRAVARVPQLAAFGLIRRPREPIGAVLGGDRRGLARLSGHVVLGDTVKFQKQRRRDDKRSLLVAVDHFDLQFVGKLYSRHGDGVLRQEHDALHRV